MKTASLSKTLALSAFNQKPPDFSTNNLLKLIEKTTVVLQLKIEKLWLELLNYLAQPNQRHKRLKFGPGDHGFL